MNVTLVLRVHQSLKIGVFHDSIVVLKAVQDLVQLDVHFQLLVNANLRRPGVGGAL